MIIRVGDYNSNNKNNSQATIPHSYTQTTTLKKSSKPTQMSSKKKMNLNIDSSQHKTHQTSYQPFPPFHIF